jgi:acyl dehydratase
MPLPLELIGASTEPVTQAVDARWTMAYAAALEDLDDRYFDTRRGPVPAHPLFPVCIEWAAVTAARRLADPAILTPEEAARGVHATHDLVLHRPVRAGDLLTTTATVELIEARRPGAYQVLRLDTVDPSGSPVCTTRMGSLFLGVSVSGSPPARPSAETRTELPGLERPEGATQVLTRAISATAAHVYTACSRIWNPIHTDVAVAERAGLPGPILHGTATLGLALSSVIRSGAGGDPASVHRVAGRFGAMVTMPSEVTIHLWRREEHWIGFEVRNQHGDAVIRDGLVGLRT